MAQWPEGNSLRDSGRAGGVAVDVMITVIPEAAKHRMQSLQGKMVCLNGDQSEDTPKTTSG